MENWKIKSFVESRWFQAFVIAVILLNSVVFTGIDGAFWTNAEFV